jgi:hypothetical protein
MRLVFRRLFEQVVRMAPPFAAARGAIFLIRFNPSAENLAMFAMEGRLLAAIASSAARSLLSLTCDGNSEVESSAVRRAEGGP